MDPLTVAVDGALVMFGLLIGRLGRRKPAKTAALVICSCGHGFGTHENDGGMCRAEIRREHYMSYGARSGHEWVRCPCLFYDGPEPLPRAWLPG